jgi:hypothetical protein
MTNPADAPGVEPDPVKLPSRSAVRSWRIAFAAGLAALVLTTAIVFNQQFSFYLAAVSLVVVLLNNLLAPPRADATTKASSEEPQSGWLLGRMRRLLERGQILRAATILVWVLTVTEWGWAAFNRRDTPLQVRVVTPSGPAGTALLFLLGDPSVQTSTDASGDADLPIKHSIRGGDTLSLIVRWREIDTTVVLTIPQSRSRRVVVRLGPGPAPFRERYVQLFGEDLPALRNATLGKKWDSIIDLHRKPTIIPTTVYQTFMTLPEQRNVFVDPSPEEMTEALREADRDTAWHFLHVNGEVVGGTFQVGGFGLLRSARATDVERWFAHQRRALWDYTDTADRTEAQNSLRAAERFQRLLGSRGQNLFVLQLSTSPCGVPIGLLARELTVRALVLDNPTGEALHLGAFDIQTYDPGGPRTWRADRDRLAKLRTTGADLYSPGWLAVGGVVVIPLALTLASDTSGMEGFAELWEGAELTLKEIESLPDLMPVRYDLSDLAGGEAWARGNIGELRTILKRGPYVGTAEQVVGPSVRVAGIHIAGAQYVLRNPINYAAVLEGPLGSGSCPVVYTSASGTEVWVRRGEILRDRQGKSREGTSEIQIPATPLRIQIAEEETETSLIDRVYLRGRDSAGRTVLLRARDPRLRAVDGRYLTIRQGQRIEVELEPPVGRLTRVWLGATGYFLRR